MAADSADIKVDGSIVPPACVPSMSGGAVFDYGGIKAASLAQDAYNGLSEKSLDISVTCDSPMKIAFAGIDNRAGTAADVEGVWLIIGNAGKGDTSTFGLGTTSAGQKIGVYKMIVDSTITLDGKLASLTPLKSENNGET